MVLGKCREDFFFLNFSFHLTTLKRDWVAWQHWRVQEPRCCISFVAHNCLVSFTSNNAANAGLSVPWCTMYMCERLVNNARRIIIGLMRLWLVQMLLHSIGQLSTGQMSSRASQPQHSKRWHVGSGVVQRCPMLCRYSAMTIVIMRCSG